MPNTDFDFWHTAFRNEMFSIHPNGDFNTFQQKVWNDIEIKNERIPVTDIFLYIKNGNWWTCVKTTKLFQI